MTLRQLPKICTFFFDGFPIGIDDQILTAAHSKLHELERSSLSLACVFVSESGAELVNGERHTGAEIFSGSEVNI